MAVSTKFNRDMCYFMPCRCLVPMLSSSYYLSAARTKQILITLLAPCGGTLVGWGSLESCPRRPHQAIRSFSAWVLFPTGALFFSAKDAFSTAISNISGGQYADLTTIAAVGLAQFPYWGIRTPAELLKIRCGVGVGGTRGSRSCFC